MSYTIVDDNGVIQIRAAITTADEFGEFMEKLDEVRIKLESQEAEKVKQEKTDASS